VSVLVRAADSGDAAAIAAIHNEGVADRVATFRSDPRPVAHVDAAIASGAPLLVAEREGKVVGWAGVGPYDDANDWYEGVGEATVYVARAARQSGTARELLGALEVAAVANGRHKLIAKIFDTNEPSLRLFERAGYAWVGVHRRHGRLDGEWKDVVVLEKLLGD
jgi:phosphinothricin acetyltransferase